MLDDLEDGLAIAGDELLVPKRRREQGDGLLELDAPREEAFLAEGPAPDEVVPKDVGRPDAELGAAPGLDAVADRDGHVEVV